MEIFITFFRDILNGPLYIVIAIIAGILICSCIGYLAEQSELKKKKQAERKNEYADVPKNGQTTSGANNNVVNTFNSVQQTTTSNTVSNSIPQNLQSSTQQTPKV